MVPPPPSRYHVPGILLRGRQRLIPDDEDPKADGEAEAGPQGPLPDGVVVPPPSTVELPGALGPLLDGRLKLSVVDHKELGCEFHVVGTPGGELPTIRRIGLTRLTADWRQEYHEHPYLEIEYVARGHGVEVVGDVIFPVEAGDLFLMRPREPHKGWCDPRDPYDVLYVMVDVPAGETSAFVAPWTEFGAERKPIHIETTGRLRETLDRLAVEMIERQPGSDLAVQGLVFQLLAELARGRPGGRGASTRVRSLRVRRIVEQAQELIRANLDDRLSVEDMADRFFLSPAYFGELFKQECGQTVAEFQTQVRMRKARELLADMGRTVSEVAHAAGYADLAYFSRVFHKTYGISPTRFRERLAGQPEEEE